MLPLWERILYFHFVPAMLDALIALAGILLLLRIFRVRNPSVRTIFLFVPLVRPLFVFLEGANWPQNQSKTHMLAGFRIPDPLNIIPHDLDFAQSEVSILPQLIALLILLALLAALAFFVFRWLGFMFFYKKLRRKSRHLNTEEDRYFGSLVRVLSQKMGLDNVPEILVLKGNWATPCAIGWRHPALIINPGILTEFAPEELRAIVAHELGHIKRSDCLWHWISVLLRDIQSINPFCHLSHNRIALEREKACDRDAIEVAHVPPRLLAECLLKISKLLFARQSRPLPGYGMSFFKGSGSAIRKRMLYMLSFPEVSDVCSHAASKLGKAKIAGLVAICIPMTLLQFYVCFWLGSFPLVIK